MSQEGRKASQIKSAPDRLWLRRFIMAWHRRLGLISSILIIVLVITGVILNRTVELQLDEWMIKSPFVSAWYGLDPKSQPISFKAGTHWVTVLDDHLYIDTFDAGQIEGTIVGAVVWDEGIVVGRKNSLTAYSIDGQLFDHISADELPGPLTIIGQTSGGSIAVKTKTNIHSAAEDLRTWQASESRVEWSKATKTPPKIKQSVIDLHTGRGLPMGRILLDLHSGRLFGPWGPYVMDAAAIILLLLTLSGFYNWWWVKRW